MRGRNKNKVVRRPPAALIAGGWPRARPPQGLSPAPCGGRVAGWGGWGGGWKVSVCFATSFRQAGVRGGGEGGGPGMWMEGGQKCVEGWGLFYKFVTFVQGAWRLQGSWLQTNHFRCPWPGKRGGESQGCLAICKRSRVKVTDQSHKSKVPTVPCLSQVKGLGGS